MSKSVRWVLALTRMLAAAGAARAEGEWTEIGSEKGSAGNRAHAEYVEFELAERSSTRFRWDVTVNPPQSNKHNPYFRLKLERWAERNGRGAWQNVGQVVVLHQTNRGEQSTTVPAGKYQLTIYAQDVSFEVGVDRR